MVKYEFYADTNIMELEKNGIRLFFDLRDMGNLVFGEDSLALTCYAADDVDSVRDLFASYGCLEKCPIEDSEVYINDSGCPSKDREHPSPACSVNAGGYCSVCGAGRDHS